MTRDWYKRKSWTEEDKRNFFARLEESGDDAEKARFLNTQAAHLEESDPAVSLELLSKSVKEFPQQAELSQAFLQMAHCSILLGDEEGSVGFFRKALDREKTHPEAITHAYLHFPIFAVSYERSDLYAECLLVLGRYKERPQHPSDQYWYHAALAMISQHSRDHEAARLHAEEALDAASARRCGVRQHPKLLMLGERSTLLEKKLEELASN
jgi:tetratricopeptide (TPR) repeat protein